MGQEDRGGTQIEEKRPRGAIAPPEAPPDTKRPPDQKQTNDNKPGEPPPPPRSRRAKYSFWVGAVLLLLLAFLLYRYFTRTPPKAPAQQAGAAITTGMSTTGDTNIYVTALGTVTPVYTNTIFSQITGQVMGVYYKEGQTVHQGDPLIDIDPRPYQANLAQAQGTLERDQGLLAQAQADLQRYEAAYERNAISAQQVDDQRHLVQQYQGTVRADQGAVEFAQVQLAYCHIVAPITGLVGLRLVDPGNTVFAGSGSTLVVITQLQPITVVFNVAEDELPEVQTELRKHTLQVAAFDRSDEHMIENGTLTALDNQIDTTTGTVKFRAQFPNRMLQLYPNQFVNARLLVRTLHNVVLIPSAALQRNGTEAFVYVVKPDNTVAVQNVTVLTANEQQTAVQGLPAGTTLATSGFDRLESGVRVSPQQRTPSQQNNPATPVQ